VIQRVKNTPAVGPARRHTAVQPDVVDGHQDHHHAADDVDA
jgi:hypothetical protein